jgi:hypothetical protein
MYLILRILKFDILRVPPIRISTKRSTHSFQNLTVRREKNKKDKKIVSVNRFAMGDKFTRAQLAYQIFVNYFGFQVYIKTNSEF